MCVLTERVNSFKLLFQAKLSNLQYTDVCLEILHFVDLYSAKS